jgi:hypothetical protein
MREIEKLRKEVKLINPDDVKELNKIKIKNFDKHPDLKRRLKNYVTCMYESDAILDDKHLLLEFEMLQKTKKIGELLRNGEYY